MRPPPLPPRPPPRRPLADAESERETLRSSRRDSVRTLFELRGRVTLVWALISLALGLGAYILVRAVLP